MTRLSARSFSIINTLILLLIVELPRLVGTSPNPPTCNGPMLSYGSCPNININYSYNPTSGISQYAPADQNKFNVGKSTDLASIESSICSTLGSPTCGASAAAVSLCWQIFWSYSGLTGSQGVQTWNSLIAQGPTCNSSSTTSTVTVTVYVSASSTGGSVVATTIVKSSDDATTTIVNTDMTTVTMTSTLRPGSSSSTVTSTSTTRGTKTSTTDTTLTRTITSFTSSSTQDRAVSTSTSDPFSMNGSPFIYNVGTRLSLNPVLVVSSLIMPILIGSLSWNHG